MTRNNLDNALELTLKKTAALLEAMKHEYPRFPHSVRKGAWKTSGDDEWQRLVNGYWTGGFWVGMLFLAHRLTGSDEYLKWAKRWMSELSPRRAAAGMHDLGFLFFPSAVAGCELTGDEALVDMAVEAAGNVAGCYSGLYRCLYIFDRAPMNRILAVDTMMNLPLLWWAARKTGNDVLRRIAVNHAASTLELAVRDNGATVHIIKFEEFERTVEETASWQGRAPDSCWSRGQAWAISGYAYSYMFTGDVFYRRALDRTLAFFVENLDETGVPFWDLLVEEDAAPNAEKQQRDSSALAAAAHALVQLSGQHRQTALGMLDNLVDHCMLPPEEPGILGHACFHRPANIDTDCACIFGDYYFMFALALATGRIEPFFKPS